MNNTQWKAMLFTGMLTLLQLNAYTQVTGGLGGSSPDPKMAQGATATGLSSLSSPNAFDGSTAITIPIQQYSLEGKEFGISLSYDTRGVKVNECATPAGTHWQILAEGSITRVIKDLPDELYKETIPNIEFDNAIFVNKNRVLKGKYVTYTETAAQLTEPNVYRDGECDDFFFSCGGKSFRFNLGKDMNVFTHPHTNIKITPLIDGVAVWGIQGQPVGNWGTSSTNNILEFQVRDEEGNLYYFARGDYEYHDLFTNEYFTSDNIGHCYPVLRWVIKKITFANGNEINYTYSEPLPSGALANFRQYYTRELVSPSSPVPYSANFLFPTDETAQQYTSSLTGIQYPNGTQATFIYDPADNTELELPLLKEIKISSGAECLRYKLNQSKVNNRWFLNSIKLLSCDGSLEEPYYSFEYNPIALPSRLSSAQDYYGYYNGNPNGTALQGSGTDINVPIHHSESGANAYLNYGNSRVVNAGYAQAGILTKVKNAFGGEMSFRYSANQGYSMFPGSSITLPTSANYFMGVDIADGLRVDSIIEKDKYHPGNSKITTYEYFDGQLFMPGGYFHYPEYIDSATNNWSRLLFQSMFLTSHQLVNGSNHGYSQVSVKTYTNSGALLSRMDMKFTNMKDETSNWQPRYYANGKHYFEYPYTDKQYLKDWEIGLPLEITEYDQNNRIVKRTNNRYNLNAGNPSPVTYLTNTKTAKVQSGTGISVLSNGVPQSYYPNKKIYTDTYSPYTQTTLLLSTRVKNYVSDTRYVEDSTTYAYDERDNIQTVTTLNSKGEKINTRYVYNYEAGGTGVTGGAAPGSVLYNMTENGLEKVISEERWKPGTGTIYDQKLIAATLTSYTYQGGILRLQGSYEFKSLEPVSYSSYTGLTMGGPSGNPFSKAIVAFTGSTPSGFDKATDIKLTDAKGNPLETQLLGTETYKAMIWDTDNGKMLAEVANARYADIAFSGFEASNQGNFVYSAADVAPSSSVPGGSISGNYVLKAINTNSSPLSHNGLTAGKEYTMTFWCYGGTPTLSGAGLGQIPITVTYTRNGWSFYIAKFTPANNNSLGFIQTGSPGAPFFYYLDDIRLCPSSAVMQNYNYIPLFGMTAATDGTGKITYYEYDKMGRKAIVRDQKGNIISKTEYRTGGGL